MVTARSGQPFEATLEGVASGLTGTVALTVDDGQGTAVVARSTAGIVELSTPEPGAGVYLATRAAPTTTDPQEQFTLVWDLGDPDDPDDTYTETLLVRSLPAVAYLPEADEVATLLRARTKDRAGNEIGSFTGDTRPTDVQVESLISQVTSDVVMRVGATIPDDLHPAARRVITLGAAAEIERGYQPDQSVDTFSPYQTMRLSFEEARAALVTAVQLRDLFSETDVVVVAP